MKRQRTPDIEEDDDYLALFEHRFFVKDREKLCEQKKKSCCIDPLSMEDPRRLMDHHERISIDFGMIHL